MPRYKITAPANPIKTELEISGSKSISNRVLIIKSLCTQSFDIENLSESDDTSVLKKSLQSPLQKVYDVHHAGTSFRFLTAYLCLQSGYQILTGSDRMKQRPIAPLVEALKNIGVEIEYLEKEGFPPLKIGTYLKQKTAAVKIKSNISSQFISALCLIAPRLPLGLQIQLEGKLVSKPYLEMTLKIMSKFGIKSTFNGSSIHILPQPYEAVDYVVESDWSSAGYHYAIAALIPNTNITLKNFFKESLQGDCRLVEMMVNFGVQSSFGKDYVELKSTTNYSSVFAYDFIEQPDLFQTIAVLAAAKNIKLYAKGLSTLKLKETNRIVALQTELAKIGVSLNACVDDTCEYELLGNPQINLPEFETYNDHRMAMALSVLSCIAPIWINDVDVVNKSYPSFWENLQKLGFTIS